MGNTVLNRKEIFMGADSKKIYTVADIEALPEGKRAELIDGEMFEMACPTFTHQSMLSWLNAKIAIHVMEHNGPCRVLPAPFAVYILNDDYNYVEPDISVICDRNKVDDRGCHGAPDWVIEIVSPSSKPRDYIKKMLKYGTANVREYWIVDPEEKIVTVYGFENETMKQYPFGKAVPVGIYEGFSINVS